MTCPLCGQPTETSPDWKEGEFTKTFALCWHVAKFPIIYKGKELADKIGFQPLLKMMVEYAGDDKPWAWVAVDILKPRVSKEARTIPDTSIECKDCGKQARCETVIGDVHKHYCSCGWWAELRDGKLLKQGRG